MKFLTSLFLLIFTYTISNAQVATEALRYSQLSPSGTARVVGAGGAFGAMGGDFGGISINPAVIANYWYSEFTFTPSFNVINGASTLENTGQTNNTNASFNLDHIGVVFTPDEYTDTWTSSNFAIGYNKIANYDENFEFEGKTTGSIVGYFADQAAGRGPGALDNFIAGPAYEVGAIFEPDNDNIYSADFDPFGTDVQKEQSIERRGGMNELVFGWGGSIKNKVNLGVSINVPFVNFEERKVYRESDNDNTIDNFNQLSFSENLTTSGVGISAKIGAIVNLNPLRIGFSYHTPTILSLQDSFYTVHYYSYTLNDIIEEADSRSPDGVFDYRLKTPARMVASLGYLLRSDVIKGFLNADFEFVNYAGNKFNLTSSDLSGPEDAEYQDQINGEIDRDFRNVVNVRLGAEIAKGKWRVRSGVSLNPSPFKNGESDLNTIVGLGLGFRTDSFYIDLGGRAISNSFGYVPYQAQFVEEDQNVDVDLTRKEIVITAGFVF